MVSMGVTEPTMDLVPEALVEPSPPQPEPSPATVVTSETPTSRVESSVTWTTWLAWVSLAYLAAIAVLLGRCLLGYVGLWRWWRNSQPAPAELQDLCAELSSHWRRPPEVRCCARLRSPISFGLWRPRILIPVAFAQHRQADERRQMFVHELTHLERRDSWSCLLLALAQSCFFFVPWFWWVRRQIRLCQEYVADAVAAALTSSETYAQYLLALSTRGEARALTTSRKETPVGVYVTGIFWNSSDLFRRIAMLLHASDRVEKRCPRWWAMTAIVGLAGLALLLSGIDLHAKAAPDQPAGPTPLAADPPKDPAPAKDPARAETPEEAIRRALEDFKKKEEPAEPKPAAPRPAVPAFPQNPEDLFRRAFEDMQRFNNLGGLGQGNDQLLKMLQLQMEQMQRLQNLQPGQAPDLNRELQDIFKMMQQLQQLQQMPELRGFGGGLGGGGLGRRATMGRLGALLEAPSDILVDQLGLDRDQGLVIAQVLPNSSAAKAGLQNHDILLQFNGKAVASNPREFIRQLEDIKANTPVDAVVLRKGKKVELKGITLAVAPDVRRPDLRLQPFAFPRVPFNGVPGANTKMSIVQENGKFKIEHENDGVSYRINGTNEDGKTVASEIVIKADGKENTYDSLEKVPDAHQAKVKELLGVIGGGSFKAKPKLQVD
jgi:beta-lactamase regulating signal transducer with metallopeptidase domain